LRLLQACGIGTVLAGAAEGRILVWGVGSVEIG
jgi:hypothetical protein